MRSFLYAASLCSLFSLVALDAVASQAPTTHGAGAATLSSECPTSVAFDLSSMNNTVAGLLSLYSSERYQQLDEALGCLMRPEVSFSSGRPGASAAYWFYRKQMPAPGADAAEPARIAKWKAQRPGSAFAKFAELRFSYADAWRARGGAYASQTPDEALKLFMQKLGECEKAILAAPAEVRDTPLAQNLLLAVVTDGGGTSKPMDVFREGVAKWPNYYDFYEVLLSRLVPRWGGTWQAVDRFVGYWTDKRRDIEGDAMYARLYASLLMKHEDPDESLLDWTRMKRSLDDLVERYPGKENLNLAVSMACLYDDADYYKQISKKLGEDGVDGSYWVPLGDPALCVELGR